jgi:hypothetical protein
MANGHGGPRTPRSPAPVSGPGKLARRTDGGAAQSIASLPNAKYGENAEFRGLQQSAPLNAATAPQAPDLGGDIGSAPNPVPQPVPVTAGSLRPDEPVTAGVDRGPGPGSEVMALPTPEAPAVGQWRTARDAVASVASQPGAPPALRALASRLGSAF